MVTVPTVCRRWLGDGWQTTSLSAGSSGQSYRLRSRAGDFVWHQAQGKLNPIVMNLDTRHQGLTQARAAQLGIAARPIWFGRQGVLSPWLDASATAPEENYQGAAELLVRLHQASWLPPLHRPLNWQLRRYEQALDCQSRAQLHTLLSQAQQAKRTHWPKGLGRGFCHFDVGPHNLLYQQQWLLIDWEYAASADIAVDLAIAYRAYADHGQHLLAYYSRYRSDLALNVQQRVCAHLPWVDYLAVLWAYLREPKQPPPWTRALVERLVTEKFAYRD